MITTSRETTPQVAVRGDRGHALRVLHVIAQGNLAGTEMVATRLALGQTARGVEPAVAILYRGGPIEALLDRYGIRCFRVDAPTNRSPAACLRFIGILKRFRPDVLHMHDARVWASLLGWMFHRGVRVHTIHNHMTDDAIGRRLRAIYRLTRWTYSGFVAVSQPTLDAVARAAGLPRSRCTVIPNGIPIAEFRARHDLRTSKAKLGCPPDAPVIGFVGRQTPQKGVDEFLLTCVEIKLRLPAARFWILGDGEDRERHVALAGRLGLDDRVTFWGNQPEVQRWLSAMDVYLMTSRWEPFGLVVIEAMAAGVPVLGFVPADGALSTIVRNGETAILLPERDPAALAQLTVCVLQDRALRDRLVREAAKDVEERFDASLMVDRYLSLYSALMRRAHQPAGSSTC